MKTRRKSPTSLRRAWAAGMGVTSLWLILALMQACGSPSLEVTKAQYGEAWPFAVEQGTLLCKIAAGGRLRSAVLRVGEKEYALNAAAETRGYASVVPIWRNDPQFSGGRVDLKPMVTLALQQC